MILVVQIFCLPNLRKSNISLKCLASETQINNQEAAITVMLTTPGAPTRSVESNGLGSADQTINPAPEVRFRPVVSQGAAQEIDIITLRAPVKQDGHAIHQLIKQCPPLDLNSVYTYLLLCEHFSHTCVVAEIDDRVVGFVSAYVHPDHDDVLFIWQVAVHGRARGLGLGHKMLQALLSRPALQAVHYLETTVGPDNVPSRRMFHSLAADHSAPVRESALFESDLFGPGGHDDERLMRIGPITSEEFIKEQINEH